MGYYAILKAAYRRVLPASARRRIFNYPVIAPIRYLLQRHAKHDEVYDRAYFEEAVEPIARQSAPTMARSIQDEFGPRTVVDVGCGTGALLEALRDLGISGIGLERSKAALDIARSKGLEVDACDLERPLEQLPVHRCDLVISTEVAEHQPERFADTYVSYLCRTSATVALITAAIPGQGGTDHANEQPNEYWVEKFEAHGLRYLRDLTEYLRREWKAAGVADFYAANLLIFKRPLPPETSDGASVMLTKPRVVPDSGTGCDGR